MLLCYVRQDVVGFRKLVSVITEAEEPNADNETKEYTKSKSLLADTKSTKLVPKGVVTEI